MPIKVSPISSPASALISSTATGEEKPLYAAVAKEPPALGCGTTFIFSREVAAASSMMIALFKCSQH